MVKKNSDEKNETENDINPYLTNGSTTIETNATSEYQPLINPTFNTEGELTNSMVQLKGRILYPKEKAAGGSDYANVRSSATVNTDQGWWDIGNKITTIYKGNGIGKVLSETTGVHNGYSYRWFKVQLLKTISGTWGNHTTGYVRADTVTFKPIL